MTDIQNGDIINESPRPTLQAKQNFLTFPEAIKKITDGEKVTKLEWNDKSIFGYLGTDGHLKINLVDKLSDWILTDGDLLGEDWIVVPESN